MPKNNLPEIVWKSDDDENDNLPEIEQRIKTLCQQWCEACHVERMDIIYLSKDEVIFGEL